MMKVLNKIQLAIYDFYYNVTGAVLGVIIITVTLGIVSRYVFNRPFLWTEEVCTILLVYLAYCSAPMATISQDHIVADFLLKLLPKKLNKVMAIIIRIASIGFFAFLTYSCLKFIPGKTYRTPALRLPRIVFYIPVLVGAAAIVYSLIVHLLNDFFPGYDFYIQRKQAKEEALRLEEEKENEEAARKVDSFMDMADKAQKGGKP